MHKTLLTDNGIHIIENVRTDLIAAKAASDNRATFFLLMTVPKAVGTHRHLRQHRGDPVAPSATAPAVVGLDCLAAPGVGPSMAEAATLGVSSFANLDETPGVTLEGLGFTGAEVRRSSNSRPARCRSTCFASTMPASLRVPSLMPMRLSTHM